MARRILFVSQHVSACIRGDRVALWDRRLRSITRWVRPQHGGFTLIEILIVVAIVAILATLAWPSYQSAMRKNNRTAVEAHLADIAQRQQQFLLDQRGYAADLSTLGVVSPGSVTPYYTVTIAVSAGPPPSFTASATPIGSQAADLSGTPVTITNTGAKGPSGAW